MFEPRFSGDNQLARPKGTGKDVRRLESNMGYSEGTAPTSRASIHLYPAEAYASMRPRARFRTRPSW